MFGIGTSELLIIFAIMLLVFGSSRLPGLGKGLGQAIRGFRDSLRGDSDSTEIAQTEKQSTEKQAPKDSNV